MLLSDAQHTAIYYILAAITAAFNIFIYATYMKAAGLAHMGYGSMSKFTEMSPYFTHSYIAINIAIAIALVIVMAAVRQIIHPENLTRAKITLIIGMSFINITFGALATKELSYYYSRPQDNGHCGCVIRPQLFRLDDYPDSPRAKILKDGNYPYLSLSPFFRVGQCEFGYPKF